MPNNMPKPALLQEAINDMQQLLDALKQESELRYLDVVELRRRATALRYQAENQATWMAEELNKQARNGEITRWDLMSDRERQIMDLTPFTANAVGLCSVCDTPLRTEGDYARHFPISDVRYPNLGSCPNKTS